MEREQILTGHIYTANANMPFAEAMYCKDGVIQAIGLKQDVIRKADPGAVIRKVRGLILPGCTEGHAHISSTIDKLYGVNLSGGETVKEYQREIIHYITEHPNATVITGQGYRNGVFPDKGPDKNILDAICEQNNVMVPIVLQSEDCHSYWVNSIALKQAGFESETGWIHELDKNYFESILPVYSVEDYKKAILHYQDLATMYGITYAFEPMLSERKEYMTAIQAYKELAEEGKLHIYFRMAYPMFDGDCIEEVVAQILSLKKETRSECFEIIGVKFFLDGVIEGHTAYLSEPYADTPGDAGQCLWRLEELKKAFMAVEREHLQIHVHAVGDGALEMALQALEYVNEQVDITKSRHSITHLQVVKPEQIIRMRRMGIIAVLNPYWHLVSDDYYYQIETPYLGKERVEQEYPVKDFINAGIICTQGSDYPVTIPPNIWNCLGLCVMRKRPESIYPVHNPSQRISCQKALEMFTINGARQLFLDDRHGSLEAGKDADYLILNGDPFLLPEEELFRLQVEECYVKGVRVL
ncbi:MAG: amidohydrolase [Lachnospiraceae bacterium]|nr:amidohydrolase [Lachnospiraceae bacterium]